MSKPRLLDLFCCAGGCAVGYANAGFEVVGVDKEPQPNYPYEFHLADAMTYPLDGFDAIHGSPPCQHFANVTRWRGSADNHEDLLTPFRERMLAEASVNREGRQAIPPAYTEYIGGFLMDQVLGRAA